MNNIATKFTTREVQPLENLKGTKVYTLKEKILNNKKLTPGDKKYITEKVNNNSYFKNATPLSGYKFDFSEVLKKFIVKQHGSYTEYYATNKTALRSILFGRVESIIEI